jgi:hypothetical protein
MPAPTDRPTAPPEFNLEVFARDSDSRLRAAKPAGVDDLEELLDPSSDVRLAARPPIGDFLGLEAWARQASGSLVVKAPVDVLKRLPLDHRAGFLLSLMDCSLDLEALIEVSGMARDEVLELVKELHELGAVEFK